MYIVYFSLHAGVNYHGRRREAHYNKKFDSLEEAQEFYGKITSSGFFEDIAVVTASIIEDFSGQSLKEYLNKNAFNKIEVIKLKEFERHINLNFSGAVIGSGIFGNINYYFNGQLHRENGPAHINGNLNCEEIPWWPNQTWWYHGKRIYVKSQEEFYTWLMAGAFE